MSPVPPGQDVHVLEVQRLCEEPSNLKRILMVHKSGIKPSENTTFLDGVFRNGSR
jgi:hypothetical protein